MRWIYLKNISPDSANINLAYATSDLTDVFNFSFCLEDTGIHSVT